MLYESDQVGYTNRPTVSTLTTMARGAFELITRKSEENDGMLTFLIGREMYYFSLFARLRAFVHGPESADDFLANYIKFFEQQIHTNIDVATIVAKKSRKSDKPRNFEFRDQFGEITLEGDDLVEFKKYLLQPLAQRIGAYILPRVLNNEGEYSYVLLDYGEGLGFVGGGLRKGETIQKALEREVKEELGVNMKSDFGPYRSFTKPYRFSSKRGAEELHITIADINSGVTLRSKLKKAKTKTLSLDELLETRELQDEVRAYLKTNQDIISVNI